MGLGNSNFSANVKVVDGSSFSNMRNMQEKQATKCILTHCETLVNSSTTLKLVFATGDTVQTEIK